MTIAPEVSTRPLAVSYLRVSTKEQAERDGDPEGYSIPAQREANRRIAATLGADIVEEFVDRGESARSADRPELQKMLEFVREQPIAYCIVHKVDRLARNRADDVTINLALQKAQVRLVSATENIDETPSGMLLHGIMSSIAEFYSRNLANEVLKGMHQKAKTGGTPGKAPIGYRNAGVINAEGREVRTIVIDEQRAKLIAWAFETYATGDWTIRDLAEDLADRGLISSPTPARPGKPIQANQLHKIFMNPYYKGDVRFQGAIYAGRHEPIVNSVIWQKVQDVMASHVVGEKVRAHHHYLKSSVFCGNCGSRLIVHHAVNRHGNVYEYFICSGRHAKRTECIQPAVNIALVENKIVDHYRTIALSPELRAQIEVTLKQELEEGMKQTRRLQHDLLLEQARLQARSKKLLDGHLDGVVPAELYAAEQSGISLQLSSIVERLSAMTIKFSELESNLIGAMELLQNCSEAYRRAPDDIRRRFNQALFVRILVDQGGEIRTELAEPFEMILSTEGTRAATSAGDKKEPPAKISLVEGSKDELLVPLEGLEPPTVSLGRNCSSIELQRLASRVYREKSSIK
ncbi:recombinase family protein [Leifsonia bigeumensis]|uniref:Recombinase family protein n=1 Tax=Leifsonella bigeumensis TaxID=433643 RepID=A0ABP7FA37_9MICO